MGDIELCNVAEAKQAAIDYLKDLEHIKTESEFVQTLIVFAQLINCLLFKVVGEVARLTYRDVKGLSKSARLQQTYETRNKVCHLYGTIAYYKDLSKLKSLFGENFYEDFLAFAKEVVASVEDETFMEKYAVPNRISTSEISEVLKDWK